MKIDLLEQLNSSRTIDVMLPGRIAQVRNAIVGLEQQLQKHNNIKISDLQKDMWIRYQVQKAELQKRMGASDSSIANLKTRKEELEYLKIN